MTTYYVAAGGSDGANGLTTGTAWATLSHVNGFTFNSGDTVAFNRGDIWRESLTPQQGVNYTAYGSGNKPSIRGSDVTSGAWTSDSGAGITDARPGASGDDGYFAQTGSGFNSSFSNARVGDEGGVDQTTFIRFALGISQGATISSSLLTLRAGATQSGAVTVEIQAVDADNAAAPTTDAQGQALTLTTASVTWNVPNTTSGTDYDLPDIASVIQEVVDRPGWTSGNALTIVLRTTSAGTWTIRDFRTFDDASGGAKLDVGTSSALYYKGSITTDPVVLVHDGVLGRRRTSKAAMVTDWDYWYDDPNDRLYVYNSTGEPSTQATVLEYGVRNQIIGPYTGADVTFTDIDIRHNRGDVAFGYYSVNTATFTRCDFTQLGGYGIQANNGGLITVNACTFTDWGVRRATTGDNYAVQAIGAGSRIDVADSTFTLTGTLPNADVMAINCDSNGWLRTALRNTFNLGNGTNATSDEAILVWQPGVSATSIEIAYNTIINAGAMGIALQALEFNGAAPVVLVHHNTITNACVSDEADAEALRLGDFTSACDVTVHHNVILGTRDGTNDHWGIRVNAATGVKLYNNTVTGCDDGIRVCNDWAIRAPSATAKNNISAGNRLTAGRLTAGTLTKDHNDWFGTITGFTADATDITTDPLLTSSGSLSAGSPAFDTGTPITGITPASNVDMGAFESTITGAYWGVKVRVV